MDTFDATYIWIVVLGFLVAFILALGLGANDVANSFGTSVGSKVLTLKSACIVATLCETSGALLAGGKVTDTIREKIVHVPPLHNGTEGEVLVGYLSALSGGAVWLAVATAIKLPVSSTHSVVGAMIGFGLVAFGPEAIKWKEFAKIASSWVISPLLAGLVSSLFYVALQYLVLNKPDSYHAGLTALPLIYFIILTVNIFAIFYNGSAVLHFNKIPLWGCVILSCGTGFMVGVLTYIFIVPHLRQMIDGEFEELDLHGDTKLQTVDSDMKYMETDLTNLKTEETAKLLDKAKSKKYNDDKMVDEDLEIEDKGRETLVDEPKTARLLAFVQIMTAAFASFAHGSNDVSNAIGPLVSLWLTFKSGEVDNGLETPLWILLFGGIGISVGLWIWGRRVIETIGEDLSDITPSSGLIIEFGTVFTVLLASNIGVPISTTHCLVGAVILVGLVRSRNVTDWRIFRNIVFAWVVTVPVSGILAAGIFAALRYTV